MSKKILIVDDEPDILKVVMFRMKKAGYEISTATDGQKAIDLVQENKPDLMLLDLKLPVMSGAEVCKWVKESSEFKDVPIIILTASSDSTDRDMVKELGADDFMLKPFDPDVLIGKVKDFIG